MHGQVTTLALYNEAKRRVADQSIEPSNCAFERAERYLLGLRRRVPRRAPLNWVTRMHELEHFQMVNDRLPSRGARDSKERALAAWARRQRDRDDHTVFQRARLDVSPAFTENSHDAAWLARAARLRDVILTTGEPPRWLDSDPEQYRLREWWTRQLHQLRYGALAPHQAAIITELANFPARIQSTRHHPGSGQVRTSAGISTTSAR